MLTTLTAILFNALIVTGIAGLFWWTKERLSTARCHDCDCGSESCERDGKKSRATATAKPMQTSAEPGGMLASDKSR